MIYLKKIINQDLERTPTFNKESIVDFFKIKINNGENITKKIILIPDNIEYNVKFQKRETRDEYRVFLNELFAQINPEEGDIIVLRKQNNDRYFCEHFGKSHKSYNHLNHLFDDRENHQLIIEDEEDGLANLENNYDNLMNRFVEWFVSHDGNRHNYFSDSFASNKDRLIEHLIKYEQIYNNEFNSLIFTITNSDLEDFISHLEKNLYQESGGFHEFSLKTSTHMPRAILGKKNYLAFLREFLKKINLPQESFDPNAFYQSLRDSNLKFEPSLGSRLIASLCTKPFLILTGLTGSGKTKLAQSFAYWITDSADQYEIVPVGSDWTNREPLLGYPDSLSKDPLIYVHPDSKILDLIIRAENSELPHFLILDEMNLSHVERYFADFLSILESGESAKLYSGSTRYDGFGNEVPQVVTWPKNLFIVGTVNIDESTYMFSPKVLDRANVIEFRLTDREMEEFLKGDPKIDLAKLKSKGATMALDFVHQSNINSVSLDANTQQTLLLFFKELKTLGAEFGYRSANEIGKLMFNLGRIDSKMSQETKIDIAIMQKMLPKLHGSRSKLNPVLEKLGKLCLKDGANWNDYIKEGVSIDFEKDEIVKYKMSFEKIIRMYNSARTNGFASYAEA